MDPKYRTFWHRFAAAFIDGIVFIPIFFAENLLLHANIPWLTACWIVLSTCMLYAYSILMHWQYGQTLGKMVMDIEVLHTDEETRPSLKQAILRDGIWAAFDTTRALLMANALLSVGYYYSAEVLRFDSGWFSIFPTLWIIVELLTMLLHPKRRALHDLIAGTVVVRKGFLAKGYKEVVTHRSGSDKESLNL